MNKDDYLEELREIIDMPYNYFLLTSELFRTEYVPDSPMNESRVVDVIHILRDPLEFHSDYPVSIFEVFIALSIRTANDIMGGEPGEWFWRYMDNWGMSEIDDEHWDVCKFDYFLERIWLAFGIQKMKSSRKKLEPFVKTETVDLWKCMINYLSDNFV